MSIGELERNLIQRVCVGDIVARAAAHYPDKVGIIDGQLRLTYRHFNEVVNRTGHALLSLGLNHQDRVAIASRNTWEFLAIYFACAKAGLIAMPVNLGLKPAEIAYCLRDSNAKVLLAETVLSHAVAQVAPLAPDLEHVIWLRSGSDVPAVEKTYGAFESLLTAGNPAEVERVVSDRDVIQLLYTSGTTSMPKGVLTSHVAVVMTAFSAALRQKSDPNDVVMHVLPLFHCAQLNSLAIPAFVNGATSVILPSFDVNRVAEELEQHRVSSVLLLPMMYQALLSHPGVQRRNYSSVRYAIYAMAPMPESRISEIQALFPNAKVLLGSGQTEFTPPTTFQFPEHQQTKAASWGPAAPSVWVEIMDDHGRLLPRGETGEIVYRGPNAMEGYWNQPEKTLEAFHHGWFHSGDVGYMDDEGVVWFTDRKKDMVKTGGENVASLEVERKLLEHPDVAEAAVVGLPHDRWGEAVTGLVILKEGRSPSEQDIIAYCKTTLADFKVPKRIHFVTEFPRTGTGKIQKHELRAHFKTMYQEKSPS
ncbi:long-chain-fatty-acid--CoA ligase [Alicyclobacillus tolerans]|uniref:long-chain-fatty-acid--CoA ligase n=1 Tax=Alicyclobacillus tolerans TaxID=90970 RepID=UPI001F21D5B4|nr:long-chain-fatty-acid--CoA ligase [Alicyclobacillus tolerans]MCF8563253.1 long-chain-fatty-acid--CoA ligase [Alicyclobacillus tolerans]